MTNTHSKSRTFSEKFILGFISVYPCASVVSKHSGDMLR